MAFKAANLQPIMQLNKQLPPGAMQHKIVTTIGNYTVRYHFNGATWWAAVTGKSTNSYYIFNQIGAGWGR